MSEEAYREYMTQNHAELVKNLMVKYGVVRWTQVILSNLITFLPPQPQKNTGPSLFPSGTRPCT